MGWSDDVNYPKKYNRLIKINNKIKHEKLRRYDNKVRFIHSYKL